MKRGSLNDKKKGLSAIVSTVLILLITIPTIVILWTFVIPFVQNILLVDMSSVQLQILTTNGYTVYDSVDQLLSVQVKRGEDKINLKQIYVLINIGGNSNSYLVDAPEPGTSKVYYFGEIKTLPDKISAYASIPLARKGETAIGNCELSKIPLGDLDEQKILESGNWIYLPRNRLRTNNCKAADGTKAADGSYCSFESNTAQGFCESGSCIAGECVIEDNCYRGNPCETFTCNQNYRCSYVSTPNCENDINVCGDNILGNEEDCDGFLFGGKDCGTEEGPTFTGFLKCNSNCEIETSQCKQTISDEAANSQGVFFKGFGTIGSPFIIYNCFQLQNMSHNLTANYKLGQNIDCSMTQTESSNLWTYGKGFIPIGCGDTEHCGTQRTRKNFFKGTLDGTGFKINDLYINRPGENDVGLIGHLNNGRVINLGLVNSNIKGKGYTGGITGTISNDSIIDNSYNIGTVIGTENNIGGLVGFSDSLANAGANSNIRNSYNKAIVSGQSTSQNVGGIMGYSETTAIKRCFNEGKITGKDNVGGIAGLSIKLIEDSYNLGNITATSIYSGGIVGRGSISPTNPAGIITNSYNIGKVQALHTPGPLAGRSSPQPTVQRSYYLEDSCTSSFPYDFYGTSKTSDELKNQSTFEEWDFENVWDIEENVNEGYPFLRS